MFLQLLIIFLIFMERERERETFVHFYLDIYVCIYLSLYPTRFSHGFHAERDDRNVTTALAEPTGIDK